MHKRLWVIVLCSLVILLSVKYVMSLYSPWTGLGVQSPDGKYQLQVLANNKWVRVVLVEETDEEIILQYRHDGDAWELRGKGAISWSHNADQVTAIYNDMVRGKLREIEFHMDLYNGTWTLGVHPIEHSSGR